MHACLQGNDRVVLPENRIRLLQPYLLQRCEHMACSLFIRLQACHVCTVVEHT